MKPLEIKLNRQFKSLQKELEDYWFAEGNDSISEFADKIGREKFFEIQDIATEIKSLCKRENFQFDDELNFALDKLARTVNGFEKYLDPNVKEGFQKDFFESMGQKSKDIVDKIKEVEAMAYYANLQKLSNTINCRTWQSLGRITFIINTVVGEIMPTYKNAMNDEIIKVNEVLNNKVEEIKAMMSKEQVTEYKADIKKIFDYKEMDRLIKANGYEPVRQTGDHKIYTNSNGKTVPVPQHGLGRGLSCKIQKQISM